MATQTFEEAIKHSHRMKFTSPDEKVYTGFYADPKIDRTTLPDGWYCYDIRHDDEGCGIFVSLNADYVIVNNAGCFFTQTEIPKLKKTGSYVDLAIDPEEWKETHCCDDDDYECPECPERENTDWDYTFYNFAGKTPKL